jgi:hypothetical protein
VEVAEVGEVRKEVEEGEGGVEDGGEITVIVVEMGEGKRGRSDHADTLSYLCTSILCCEEPLSHLPSRS